MAESGPAPHATRGVAFVTLGCKVNQAETDQMAEELRVRGVERSGEDEAAVVVVNTCTVTAEADRKARKAIRHALAAAGDPVVIVTGCLAAVDPEGVASLGERVRVVAGKDLVAQAVSEVTPASSQSGAARESGGVVRRARVQVKVQDGCDTRCSYCIVPSARGGPRSRPVRDIVAEADALAAAGTREVVLTGINIGRYRDAGVDLAALVERVASAGVPRIRVSSIEPGDVTPAFLDTVASVPGFCRHLHVPLQSGSDRVLAAMRRPYDTRLYADALARARDALPGLAVTTDVITGFPGETDAEDRASREFIAQCGFSRVHVFRYSSRPGTPAASMPGQVDPGERSRRAAAMREVGARLARASASSWVGGTVEVLVERTRTGQEGTVAEGTGREYQRVICDGAGCTPGDLVDVLVVRALDDGTLAGEPRR